MSFVVFFLYFQKEITCVSNNNLFLSIYSIKVFFTHKKMHILFTFHLSFNVNLEGTLALSLLSVTFPNNVGEITIASCFKYLEKVWLQII